MPGDLGDVRIQAQQVPVRVDGEVHKESRLPT